MGRSLTRAVVLALFLLSAGCAAVPNQPRAENGVLNLRQWDFAENGSIALDGAWQWHWDRLLAPADFASAPAPTGVFETPGAWNGMVVNGERLPTEGYATFRLTVQLPRPGDYAIKLLLDKSAYRLWAGDQLLIENGVVSSDPDTIAPRNAARLAIFHASGETVELTLQLAARDYYAGGARDPILFGEAAALTQLAETRQIQIAFVIGALAILGFYQIAMYLLRRSDRAPLALGCFCVCSAIWTGTQGETVLWRVAPGLDWALTTRIEICALYLAVAAFAAFFHVTQPREFPRWAAMSYGGGGLGAALIVAAIPLGLSTQLVPIMLGVILLLAAHATFSALVSAWRGHSDAWLLAAGIAISSAAIAYDVLVFLAGRIPTFYFGSLGLLGLVGTQSFLVARRLAWAFATVDAQRQGLVRVNQAYYRFVPKAFLQLLGKDDITTVQLGDQTQRAMTVMFADIRGFTALSETLTPAQNFAFVNALLSGVSPIIRAHQGFIDKYMGDGFMALFPEDPASALKATEALFEALRALNAERASREEPPIRIGVGVHTGNLMLGTVGEQERMDGTVISDTVNVASRLEHLSVHFGASAIVSEEVAAADKHDFRPLGFVRPKGKQTPVAIYEFLGADPPEARARKRASIPAFEQGLQHFRASRFAEARAVFHAAATADAADEPAALYVLKCERYEKQGAPEGWDGAEAFSVA